jgi:multidrug efflux pump subunit AcrB
MNHTSFFDKVTFDQKLLHTTHAKYLLNFRLVLLLIVMLVILGSYSFLTLPRRLNPEIKIPIITVATVLPGSSPSDIESLVCEPLERSIKSLKGIDTYSSTSQESLCILAVQFKSGIDTEKAKDEVQSTVDQVQLPEDAQKPTVKKLDFEDQPVWVFSLHGDTDYASLQRFSSKLKDALIESVYTDRVTTLGDDKTQIEIRIRPEVSNSLGIHAGILRDAITAGLGTYPAGTVYTQNNQFTVSTPKKIKSVSDITQIGITIKGVPFKIGDIAEVGLVPLRDSKRSLSASPHEHPSESILFYVYKTSASDITVADTTFRNIVAKQMESYPRLSFYTIDSNAEQISNQFTELLDEFVSAIILVVIVIAVFLGIKQALLSSLTFPLTFLSAFALMRIAGLSIDFISLFGFLIALGLLIDDTIVTVTAMTRYHQTGKFTGKEVGLLVWRDFIVPLWSTTITTIWAFVPLLLSSGIIGEFIKPIPLVVTFNMISSTAKPDLECLSQSPHSHYPKQ